MLNAEIPKLGSHLLFFVKVKAIQKGTLQQERLNNYNKMNMEKERKVRGDGGDFSNTF